VAAKPSDAGLPLRAANVSTEVYEIQLKGRLCLAFLRVSGGVLIRGSLAAADTERAPGTPNRQLPEPLQWRANVIAYRERCAAG
jgi:hypothetical protein